MCDNCLLLDVSLELKELIMEHDVLMIISFLNDSHPKERSPRLRRSRKGRPVLPRRPQR